MLGGMPTVKYHLTLKEIRWHQPSSNVSSPEEEAEEKKEEVSDETPLLGLKWAKVADTHSMSTNSSLQTVDSSALTILHSTDHIDMETQEPPTDSDSTNDSNVQQTACTNAQHLNSDTQEENDLKCKTKLGDMLMKIIQNKCLFRKFNELRAEVKQQKNWNINNSTSTMRRKSYLKFKPV